MPAKKSAKSEKTANPPEIKRHESNKQPIGMGFVVFLLFVGIAVLSFILYRVYNEQSRLMGVISSLSNEVSRNQNLAPADNTDKPEVQYSDSEVAGLRLAYTPCPATFTGPCDDLMIYRLNEDGSKEVLIPSTRAIQTAPKTTELLHPLAVNADLTRMALGAWAYGGGRNTSDNRVWIVEISSGKVLYESTIVPPGAIFSPDMRHAAYYMQSQEGEERIMAVDLSVDEEFLAARATGDITYTDSLTNVTINWLDNNTLAVVQYDKSDESKQPVIIGEREITIN